MVLYVIDKCSFEALKATIQVCPSPSPSRSGRMDLFSLMQSIQLDDEERVSDKEGAGAQRRSPAQRRRSHKRRGLTHQRAHVDVSPDPSSLNRKQDETQEQVEQTGGTNSGQ
ncbi:hypothetical protein MHYP_G00107390 [Metynnis hypsauchen]